METVPMPLAVWLSFCLACVLFSISPGAGAIASMSNSLSYGIRKTSFSILGLQLALLMHICIVALGLGAVIASSVTAFIVLKYLGAAYLIYLGVSKWLEQGHQQVAENAKTESAWQMLRNGFLVNLTNPKSIVFLTAFFPQFINPEAPFFLQYLILGTSVLCVDASVMALYALMARGAKNLVSTPKRVRMQNRAFGTLYVATGFALATAEK